MSARPPLPSDIAGIRVPGDAVSAAVWTWANRSLPTYLFNHSVRSYCWGATIADREGWAFEPPILWAAALMHDFGLTRLSANTMCFEVEGAEIARRLLEGWGMPFSAADRVAIAIILHMQPSVTLDDGVEAVLLDRATSIDVRGDGYEEIESLAAAVAARYPRGAFDRRFLAAVTREAAARPACQSARLVHEKGLAAWMARSPWSTNRH